MIRSLLFILLLVFTFKSYAQSVFEEDFNDESSWSTWTLDDLDGDGKLWEFADAEFQEVESFDGGFVWSFSWFFEVFTPDNTLTGPVISLPADADLELSFKVAVYEDEELFQEHYAVYIIPSENSFTGEEEAVFEETMEASYYNPPKTVNIDISSFAGEGVKLVFRHKAEQTDISVFAGGNALVTVSDYVEANVTAGGKIEIFGHPQTVEEDKTLGGEIIVHK
ncbi:MAG: hypothetical protein L0J45_02150 [Psychroflexus sp.]|nr:hypothetical protein [Psychroflexus sp.]MDN6309684.1 hypothetical protein [Psychroflexus sp.]